MPRRKNLPPEAYPNRLRELRLAAGLSLQKLADRLPGKVHTSTLDKLEKGGPKGIRLSIDWMERLAPALGVAPEDFISRPTAGGGSVRRFPVAGSISSGSWQEAFDSPNGYVYAPADVGGEKAFALFPYGESMNKLVNPGGFVIVDPEQTDLIDGKPYAFYNEHGEATFKYFRLDPPRLEPCSTDPSFKTLKIAEEPLTIVGKVVWVGFQP